MIVLVLSTSPSCSHSGHLSGRDPGIASDLLHQPGVCIRLVNAKTHVDPKSLTDDLRPEDCAAQSLYLCKAAMLVSCMMMAPAE